MKKILLILSFMMVLSVSFVSADLTTELIACYPLNDNASNTNIDDVTNNSEGTSTDNTNTMSVAGKINTALFFDGTNEYGSAANMGYTGGTATISFWINYTDTTTDKMIVGTWWNGEQFMIYANPTAGKIRAILRESDNTNIIVDSSSTYNDGAWHHVVARANGSHVVLDIDDTERVSLAYDGTIKASAQTFKISGDPGDPNYFQATIDEIGVWNRSISDAEVTLLFNELACPFTPSGLLNSSWEIISPNNFGQNDTIWNTGGVVNVSSNLASLNVTASVASNASCRLDVEQNYTQMIAANINYKFGTTDTTIHSFTVFDNISVGNHCLYCSFITSSGTETATNTSSSGCLNITRINPVNGTVFNNLSNTVNDATVYIINLTSNSIVLNQTTNSSGRFVFDQDILTDGIYLAVAVNKNNFSEGADAKLVNVTN